MCYARKSLKPEIKHKTNFPPRFGRKTTLLPCVLVMSAIGTILPFMPNIQAFMALRLFLYTDLFFLFHVKYFFVWEKPVVRQNGRIYFRFLETLCTHSMGTYGKRRLSEE